MCINPTKKLDCFPWDLHSLPVTSCSLEEDPSLNLAKPSDFLSLRLL